MAKIKPTLIDNVIGYLSPAAALSRVRARQQLAATMNYDAASRGRRTHGWKSPVSSADAASLGARAQLRALARDFVRNRPFAARGLSVITGNVVGSQIVPSVHAKNDRLAAAITRHLSGTVLDASGILTLGAAQQCVMNAVVADGEVLLRRRWRAGPFAAQLDLPFQVEMIEADYLNPWLTSNGKNEVIDGVEYGPTGAPVAYHILRQHPGAMFLRRDSQSDRVPAADIIHVFRADRPGQTRGVSWFAPVMMTLGDLSDYQEAEILKQKIAALMAGFITSDEPEIAASGDAEADADDFGLGEVQPGTITELPPGKSISWSDPPAVQGYDGFMRQNLAAVAMGLGITYESLAGDLSRVNFSSARMGRMEMDRNIEAWQQQIMVGQMCAGLERWIRDAAQLVPNFLDADFTIEWTAPRRPVIDPAREIPAMIKEIDAGLNSRQRAQRQLGRDPAVIQSERIADAAFDAELNQKSEGGGDA